MKIIIFLVFDYVKIKSYSVSFHFHFPDQTQQKAFASLRLSATTEKPQAISSSGFPDAIELYI